MPVRELILTILIGLVGGVAVGLQTPLAGAMTQRLGPYSSSLVIHVSGAIISAVLVVSRGGENIRAWRETPWYMLGAGVFGVILYATFSFTLPRVGAAGALVLLIIAQLTVGMLIDHFGWFGVAIRPIDASRVLATVLLLAGAYFMSR
ncbi:MAG: DMT family transporter [Anaerolineae bacterium]